MDVPWYGWIVAIGVIGWATMVIIGSTGYARRKGGAQAAQILEQNMAVNQAVLSKLEAIETRLGVVEKTLTDIH
jgi:hypothetical protein